VLYSAVSIHYIGANSDSAVSTHQVKVKREVKVKTEVKVKRQAKVQRTGMTTRHNAKIKHDSKHADSHSDASSTKLKLRRILAETAGTKCATDQFLELTKVVSSSETRSFTSPRRRSITRKDVDDEDGDTVERFISTKLKPQRMLARKKAEADDSEADSHSDASSTKLKLMRILAKTAGRKSGTNKLKLTKVMSSVVQQSLPMVGNGRNVGQQ
jgi:hypothetical protein